MPSSPRRLRALPSLPFLVAVLCALFLAACGSTGDPDAEPASVVPASAPLYFEVTVRPEGDVRADAEAAARKIFRQDQPVAELRRLIDQALAEEQRSFEEDIEPWLGKRIGFFATSLTQDEPDVAFVAAVEDTQEAIDAIAGANDNEAELEERDYNGTDYLFDAEEGSGLAEVGEFVVLASEPLLGELIDAQEDGEVLTDDERFSQAREAVGEEGLGFGYLNLQALLDLAGQDGSVPPQTLEPLRQLIGESAALSLTAQESAVALDVVSVGTEPQPGTDPAAVTEAVRALPAGSLVGLGLGDVGDQIETQLTASGLGPNVLGQVEQSTGLNIREDLLSWMGQGSAFVQGTGIGDVGGALIVETDDPQATLDALEKIQPLLEAQDATVEEVDEGGLQGLEARFEGLPVPVYLVVAEERFLVAIGDAALDSAVRPEGALGDDQGFTQAAGALGEGLQPSFYASVPGLVTLAESFGLAQDPSFQQASPYLDAFTALVGGSRRDGEVSRNRVVLGLAE
ncbi:MAG: DUF3352 domain-containing protein [Solirubrobacteraceae bacterium MAG38_C4-C5]|nr:DUF3352 domain-containing protein [Candidatus Siliceabacter maunaloa]